MLINTPISRFFEGFKARRLRKRLESEEREKERALKEAEEQEMIGTTVSPGPRIQAPGLGDGNMTEGQRKILDYMQVHISQTQTILLQ